MAIDLNALNQKLKNSCEKMGTFGRGDPAPTDEWVIVLTGEEKSYLQVMLEMAVEIQKLNGRISIDDI